VHIGLDQKGAAIKLEKRAVNDASFRTPDEDGRVLSNAPVDDSAPWGTNLFNDLPLVRLKERLERRPGFPPIVISEDAGRFLCNFAYYLSLASCGKFRRGGVDRGRPAAHALFVHIPPFEQVGEEVQYRALLELLTEISAHLQAEAAAPAASTS
jgi:pyroglutamyl-peptidase